MQYKKTILLVEDEIGMVDLLTAILTASEYRILTAGTGKDALCMRLSHNPDLILLDLGLPDMDGQVVLRETRALCEVPIIVLSARQDESDKVEALENGANDYLTKPFGNSELLVRIRNTIRLHERMAAAPFGSEQEYQFMNFHINYPAYRVSINDVEVHLTPNEYKIVEFLSKNAGRVLTHEQIISHVWGPNNCESQVLRVNMANLRRKIESDPADPRIIQTELGIGYRMEVQRDKRGT